MFAVANSAAMDAAASGGGPSTVVLPSIVTGEPEAILAYAAQLTQRAARLASHLAALERAKEELSKVWSSGSASENVLTKLTKSFSNFSQIIDAANGAVQELGTAAAKLTIAQTAYTAVVNAVNPVVSALMSNPWTYGAAVALAEATTWLLKVFVEGIGAILNIIGSVNIIKIATDLITIISAIDQLASGNHDNGTSTQTANAAIASSPVAAPAAVSTVASATGQSVLNGTNGTNGTGVNGVNGTGGYFTSTDNYQLPTSGSGSTLPASYAYRPAALDPSNSWVAVDPATAGSSVTPATHSGGTTSPGGTPVPAGPGHHDVTITASKGDLQMTVTVPVDTGQELDMDINLQSGSETLHEHIDVAADGSVKVG